MKLHLRVVHVCGTTYRLVSLRPGTQVSFSTNYYHDTWHILSDRHGARLLGRLMWGLSFQRRPGTAILIDGEHIQPTPFGAENSDPILLTIARRTEVKQAALRVLHRNRKRLGPSQTTLRWHTFGLDQALEREASKQRLDGTREYDDDLGMWYQDKNSLWAAEQMFRRGGFVCYCAPPLIMRQRARNIAQLDPTGYGMDYYYLADSRSGQWPDGEIQIFANYHERRSAAAEARHQILKRGCQFADPHSLYAVVAERRDHILRRRKAAKARRSKVS